MARTLTAGVLAIAALVFVFAPTARADDGSDLDARIKQGIENYMKTQKADTFRVFWKDGLNFETADKRFTMAIGGRTQLDYWFYNDDNLANKGPFGEWRSGYEFRRLRLKVKGTLWEHTAFCTQLDFAGGGVSFKDVYLKFVKLDKCWGCAFPDITVGHFYEQFSLESLTSDLTTTFIERALPVDCFQPERHTGVGLSKSLRGDTITWALGVFGHDNANNGKAFFHANGKTGGYDVTGRVTWLPWAPCDCQYRFLEVGVSGSYQSGFDQLQYAATPESHLGSKIVDTGAFDADSVVLVDGELAFGYDRFHLQGEWIGAFVKSTQANDPKLNGWYVEASWMLTGPPRPFKRNAAQFGAVKPCRYFLQDCRGMGAWEIAARYSTLDLTDSALAGGQVDDVTVGLNWYLNKNTRIDLNYVYTDVKRGGISDTMNAFGMRFQIWF